MAMSVAHRCCNTKIVSQFYLFIQCSHTLIAGHEISYLARAVSVAPFETRANLPCGCAPHMRASGVTRYCDHIEMKWECLSDF